MSDIQGTEALARTLRKVAADIQTQDDSADAVGRLILAAAQARVPVVTGRLMASASYKGSTIIYSVPYANPVHWGWATRGIQADPWAFSAAVKSEPAWVAVYEDIVQQGLNRVKGA